MYWCNNNVQQHRVEKESHGTHRGGGTNLFLELSPPSVQNVQHSSRYFAFYPNIIRPLLPMQLIALSSLALIASVSAYSNVPVKYVSQANNRSNLSVQTRTRLWGLFGNSASKITYANLAFPASEMGEAAKATQIPSKSLKEGTEIATFAGGCFWGLELAFQRVPGVTQTAVGYTQGPVEMPDYGSVCSGSTGHTEAVQVYFDPSETSFEKVSERSQRSERALRKASILAMDLAKWL